MEKNRFHSSVKSQNSDENHFFISDFQWSRNCRTTPKIFQYALYEMIVNAVSPDRSALLRYTNMTNPVILPYVF